MSKEAMSKEIRELFDQSKQPPQIGAVEAIKQTLFALAPGLENLASDVHAEVGRQMTHGSMEIAAALWTGNGFVQYGPGQYTPTPERDSGVHGPEGVNGKGEAQQERQREEQGRSS